MYLFIVSRPSTLVQAVINFILSVISNDLASDIEFSPNENRITRVEHLR